MSASELETWRAAVRPLVGVHPQGTVDDATMRRMLAERCRLDRARIDELERELSHHQDCPSGARARELEEAEAARDAWASHATDRMVERDAARAELEALQARFAAALQRSRANRRTLLQGRDAVVGHLKRAEARVAELEGLMAAGPWAAALRLQARYDALRAAVTRVAEGLEVPEGVVSPHTRKMWLRIAAELRALLSPPSEGRAAGVLASMAAAGVEYRQRMRAATNAEQEAPTLPEAPGVGASPVDVLLQQYELARKVIDEVDLHCHHGPSFLARVLEHFDDELIADCLKAGAGEDFKRIVNEAREHVANYSDRDWCEDCDAVELQRELWAHIQKHGDPLATNAAVGEPTVPAAAVEALAAELEAEVAEMLDQMGWAIVGFYDSTKAAGSIDAKRDAVTRLRALLPAKGAKS